jgi:hypothetical protein
MAARGGKHALELLVADLNDPRRYVREWTLGAIEQSLGPTRGLGALKAVQPTLTHTDTRTAVDRVVKQWEQEPKPGGAR